MRLHPGSPCVASCIGCSCRWRAWLCARDARRTSRSSCCVTSSQCCTGRTTDQPSPTRTGPCSVPSRRPCPDHSEPVGAGNSAVVVDLPRCGPMLSPRVPNLVPIPGPRMERETPGQRPRPNNGHPQGSLPPLTTVPTYKSAVHYSVECGELLICALSLTDVGSGVCLLSRMSLRARCARQIRALLSWMTAKASSNSIQFASE